MIKNGMFLLILVLFSNVLITGSFYPLLYVTAALLHEIGHLLTIRVLGHAAPDVKCVGIGIRIKNNRVFSYRHEMMVAFAGPIINIVLALLGLLLLLIHRTEVLKQFVLANAIYALINLLPLKPLDGYKILSNVLLLKLPYRLVGNVLIATNVIAISLLIIFLIMMIWSGYLNFSLAMIIIVLLIGALFQFFGD